MIAKSGDIFYSVMMRRLIGCLFGKFDDKGPRRFLCTEMCLTPFLSFIPIIAFC
jgi:hypothetical protein